MHQKVIDHFKTKDPILHQVIVEILKSEKEIKDVMKRDSEFFFIDLCESIISQQLSVKASDTIYKRFEALFPEHKVTPEFLLKLDEEEIRECGVSRGKVSYLKDLAQKVYTKEIVFEKLVELSDDQIIAELIKVKGIGKWTAEMFLLFSLGREDIYSKGDLGLKNALKKLYKLDELKEEVIDEIIAKWSPYKSYASRILWKSLELK